MTVRMRSNSHHTGARRSHHALKRVGYSQCKDCGHPRLNHRACVNCGKYRGKVVVDTIAKAKRKAEKLAKKSADKK
ncbi:50S ribosomal protein L32 [Candidatus Nomurabacteria bacterium]|nr:50S ribosomal protein L32 [Candidatus Nomurabacteria bacterium]